MSDYFRVLKDGEKVPKVTPDKINKEQIEKEFDRYIKENLENEINRLQKVMEEQDKQFEKLGKKRNEVEYDENGHILVDINDERQMKLWSE
jgi:predicted ribosome quality control (RQC) complex YloA/Tae2 family protein